ncbi:MAG: branched-chain amino acid ABC transporter permease [Chloroflexi bacterium]|nr:MAG: branched-chain amino acid ABC transporter permease [Chloroflexota bacterium]
MTTAETVREEAHIQGTAGVLRRWGIWLLVLLILVMLPFLLSWSTGAPIGEGLPRFWQGLLVQVFILAVYAMSYDLLMGYTGILSFGHAMFFGTGAYVVGILMKHFTWSLPHALLAAIAVAVIQSLVIGVLSLRVKGVYFAMVTLAFAEVFFILSEATDFRQYTGAEDGLQGIPVPAWINPTDHRLRFYYLALAFAVLMYVLARRIVNSPTGRVMIAIRENEDRALILGYNTFLYKLIAMVVAGVFAALAGVLSALWNFGASPSLLSVDRTIDALLMTIIGGVGTLVGPMLGAGVLELLGYWLNRVFGPRWPLAFGLVYVLIVLFLPYGIVGTWRQRSFAWRRGWQELLGRLGFPKNPR